MSADCAGRLDRKWVAMNRNASSRAEHQIEKLVEEIDRFIQGEQPDQRRELRLYASALIADITSASSVQPGERVGKSERRPFGLIAGGLALLAIGGGLSLILPQIGIMLIFLGVVLGIWGAAAGWWTMPKKRDV